MQLALECYNGDENFSLIHFYYIYNDLLQVHLHPTRINYVTKALGGKKIHCYILEIKVITTILKSFPKIRIIVLH